MPVQMTRAEYAAKYGAAPTALAPSAPVQMTHAEYMAKYGTQDQPQEQPHPLKDAIWNGFLGAAKNIPVLGGLVTAAQMAPKAPGQIADQFNSGVNKVKEGFSDFQSPDANPIIPIKAGLKVGAGAIEALSSPTAPTTAPLGEGIQSLGDLIGSHPAVQKFAQSPAGDIASQVAEGVGNAATIAGTVAAIPKGFSFARSSLTSTPAEHIANQTAQVSKVAYEWQKPTVPGKSTNPASFNKATDVLAQNPDTPKFLAEQGINPFDNIEKGRYTTADTADALRSTAGKMSSDALRPSLQQADYSTPRTPVKDITAATIRDIKASKGVTAGDAAAQVAKAQREGAILQQKYPNGMSLTDMHDEKITYSSNGKYSPIGNNSDNNIAATNRAFGRSLASTVETKAPATLPIKDFNSYLSQYYKAADYLDALDTKKAPVSTGQLLANRGAKVIGAVVGHGVGGGVLGGVGGYLIGGALEHAIENMTLPMRYQFLQNLKITNPPAFHAVVDFVGNEQAQQAARPALPPATTINLPAKVGESSVKAVPASKNPVSANPKTGKFQTSYSSTPKSK